MAKHIFVTGGVVSSLGKGLTCASVGMLLERRGLRVRLQKFDPYINVDPGTMSPFQHGEVYVLDDGAETDLDLGHYERFTNAPLGRECNYTTGKIYRTVIDKERHGDYLGRTERKLGKEEAEKIALFCNVEKRAVIEERDKEFSIYEVPLSLVENHLDELIVEKLALKAKPLEIDDWRTMLQRIKNPAHEVTIAVVGKYIRHNDAYKSVYEALDHAGIATHSRVLLRKIEAEEIE